MIQAMVWGLVYTSGAGMSFSGPSSGEIMNVYRRVIRSISPRLMFFGVADDAALGAAEGKPHHGALPGHPCRQGLDFVERDVGVVADAALGRPAKVVVLRTVALEDPDRAVVHPHGNGNDQHPFRPPQPLVDAGAQPQSFGGKVELVLGNFERIEFLVHLCSFVLTRRAVGNPCETVQKWPRFSSGNSVDLRPAKTGLSPWSARGSRTVPHYISA